MDNDNLPGPITKPVYDMARDRNFWPAQLVFAAGSTNYLGNSE